MKEKQKKSLQYIDSFFKKLSVITDSEEGITRLAFTEKDWESRIFIQELMRELGLTIKVDSFGNYIGRLEGNDESLPPIMIGSHMDSVPKGGNYDGPVGIVVGLDLIRRFQEEGYKPDHPIEIIVFMCEESSRFGAATLGSRAYIGDLSQNDLLLYVDKEGVNLRDALDKKGLNWQSIGTPLYEISPKSFFEVHIEQGKVLETESVDIGVVTGIAAPTRYRIDIQGCADHSGATPMNLRKDALCGAAEIILCLENLAKLEMDIPVVGTIGVVEASPGVLNVIPGKVSLGVDIRSISDEAKEQVSQNFLNKVEDICKHRNLSYDFTLLGNEKPVQISQDMVGMLAEVCAAQGVSYRKLPSGAGHDAMFMARITPTGMIFIPCKDGLSHNSKERAEHKHIVQAVNVLEDMIKKVSMEEFSW